MGEIAILHPQDLLKQRQNYPNTMRSRRNQNFNPNPILNHNHIQSRSNRRRKSPTKNNQTSPKNLIMGQVKILKRGENFNVAKEPEVLLKKDPDVLPKKDRSADCYVGEKLSIAKDVPTNRSCSYPDLATNRSGSFPNLPTNRPDSYPDLPTNRSDSYPVLPKNRSGLLSNLPTTRMGSDSNLLLKKAGSAKGDCYAGSAFFDSPPPSSVPLPGFFVKRDDQSKDLIRLLRLQLE